MSGSVYSIGPLVICDGDPSVRFKDPLADEAGDGTGVDFCNTGGAQRIVAVNGRTIGLIDAGSGGLSAATLSVQVVDAGAGGEKSRAMGAGRPETTVCNATISRSTPRRSARS